MIEQYYSTHSGADIDATIDLAKASKTRIDRNESAIGDLNNLNLRNDGHSLVTAVNTVNSGVEGGWVPFREYDSLKFGNADGPSFYCPSWELELGSSKSLTDYLSVGMKVKMTQNGIVKYFFITAMSENGVTLYGGTNYIVEDTYMQSLYFSMVKSPFGFPMDPDVWTVLKTFPNEMVANTPNAWSWYEIGMNNYIPIGSWKISTTYTLYGSVAVGGVVSYYTGLCVDNTNAPHISMLRFDNFLYGSAVTMCTTAIFNMLQRTNVKILIDTSAAQSGIRVLNYPRGEIRAICAYL